MLHAGLDLSRRRLDFHLLDIQGVTVEVGSAAPDADALRGLTRRINRYRQPVHAALESMTGARFVHDQLELAGYSGLCPRVYQSGESDRRGPLSKQGPRYLRWALVEASLHARRHPAYCERYERTRQRLGRQRGPRVAQIDLARRLAHAIWHMLTRNEPFAPAGAGKPLAA